MRTAREEVEEEDEYEFNCLAVDKITHPGNVKQATFESHFLVDPEYADRTHELLLHEALLFGFQYCRPSSSNRVFECLRLQSYPAVTLPPTSLPPLNFRMEDEKM